MSVRNRYKIIQAAIGAIPAAPQNASGLDYLNWLARLQGQDKHILGCDALSGLPLGFAVFKISR